jgi:DegV family protein with EDD domain
LTDEFKSSVNYESVPLGIQVDDYHILDDENFNQAEFLKKVAASPNCPKSSCPSPERYMAAYTCDFTNVYVITLSGALSGSYNSAVLAKNLYHEEKGEKNIHVFDSRSASGGELQIAFWIKQLEEEGKSFQEVIFNVEELIMKRKTYFVLESLEALRKNGRLSNIKAIVANTLNIKPIMGATLQGSIMQLGQARGIKKALKKMVDITMDEVKDTTGRTLIINHCNCPERAEEVLDYYLENAKFKHTYILDTRGISSLYASDGGIIVTL